MKEQSNFDRIEQYLEDELSAEDRKQFERDLETDAALKADFNHHLKAHEAVELLVKRDLEDHIQSWQKANPISDITAKKFRLIPGFKVWRIAAAVVILIVTVFLLRNISATKSPAALASDYYQMPTLPGERSGDGRITQLIEGYQAFKQKDFTGAITAFKTITENDPIFFEAQYYLGHSLYQLGKYQEAGAAFKTGTQSTDKRVKESAEWYLVLNYLKIQPQPAPFHEQFQKILKDENHYFHTKAQDLQNLLDYDF